MSIPKFESPAQEQAYLDYLASQPNGMGQLLVKQYNDEKARSSIGSTYQPQEARFELSNPEDIDRQKLERNKWREAQVQMYSDPAQQIQYQTLSRLQSQLDAPVSLSQLQYAQNLGQAMNAQQSAAASARGGGANLAAAQRLSAMQSGNMLGQAAGQSAMMGMQERQANLNALAGLSSATRGADLNRAAYGANREDANRSMERFYSDQARNYEQMRMQGGMTLEQMRGGLYDNAQNRTLGMYQADQQREAQKDANNKQMWGNILGAGARVATLFGGGGGSSQ